MNNEKPKTKRYDFWLTVAAVFGGGWMLMLAILAISSIVRGAK